MPVSPGTDSHGAPTHPGCTQPRWTLCRYRPGKGRPVLIKERFARQFTDTSDERLHAFTDAGRHLHTPVEVGEVEKALKALENDRAS